jgi:hypothetical protein
LVQAFASALRRAIGLKPSWRNIVSKQTRDAVNVALIPYLVLAKGRECSMVENDRRFINALFECSDRLYDRNAREETEKKEDRERGKKFKHFRKAAKM